MSDNKEIYNIEDPEEERKTEELIAARKKGRRRMRTIKWMWGIFLGIGLLIAVLLLLIYNGVIGYMPPIEELEDPHDKLASVVYDDSGEEELGRYFQGAGNRLNADYKSVSPHVIDALIATEDVRFEEHSGVDVRSLGRTLVKTVIMRDKSSGGASTITQQLAKQLYSQPSTNTLKRALQKPIEWMIAIKLERFYTKEEIINMYLNRFDFLNNAVGIKTAANVYFGKEPDQLNLAESATLIGMLKNPSYFNPRRHPERTRDRRNVVLDQMAKAGKISSAEAEAVKAEPLTLDYHPVQRSKGELPYVREEVRRLLTAKKPVRPKRSKYNSENSWRVAYSRYRTDSCNWEENPMYGWIEKNPKPDGSFYDLYTDGLRIYTTIDMRMQRHAEEAVYEHLGGVLQPAFFNEKRGRKNGPYTLNRAEASPQLIQNLINSAIKQTARYRNMKEGGATEAEIEAAFNKKYEMEVFAYVRENGKIVPGTKTVVMSPRDSLLYTKTILRTGMMSMDPVNGHVKAYVGGPDFNYFQYDMVSYGKRQIGSTAKPMLYALAMEQGDTPCSTYQNSRGNYGNWFPKGGGGGGMVNLKHALTTSNNLISARLVAKYTPALYIDKLRAFGITGFLEPSLPICLGPYEVPVSELVSAYTTFANKGVRVDPILVSRIEDNQGNVIYSATAHHTEVIDLESNYNMDLMLMSVVNYGTGKGLRGFGIDAEIGGKTGTTNNNSDAWFMGFSPDLVTGVWVGGEDRYIHFDNGGIGQGAKSALPIWARYMRSVYADPALPYSQETKFEFPDDYKPCGGESWHQPATVYHGGGHGGHGGGAAEAAPAAPAEPEGIFD